MEPQSNQSQELLDAGREKFMKGKITEIKFFKSTVKVQIPCKHKNLNHSSIKQLPKNPAIQNYFVITAARRAADLSPFSLLVQFQTFLFFIPFKTLNSLISPTFCYYQILNIVPQKRLPCIFSHTFLPQAPFKIQPFHNFISNPSPIFPLNIHPNKTNHKYL